MNFDNLFPTRWRISIWAGLFLLGALVTMAWICIPSIPRNWPMNPVAWWTPEEVWNRPMTAMRPAYQGIADKREIDGRPAFAVGPLGRITLGRWTASQDAMTLAFWMRLEAKPRVETKGSYIVLAESWEPNIRLQFMIENGHLGLLWSDGPPRGMHVMDGARASPGVAKVPDRLWVHVAFVVDARSVRFLADGQPAGEVPLEELAIVHNARLSLGPGSIEGLSVAYDDVVLFPRALSEYEVRSLAAAPRGELPRKYHRLALQERLRHWILPTRVGVVVLLAILGAVVVLARTLGGSWKDLAGPETRFAAGLFIAQVMLTLAAVLWIGQEARRLDRLDFEREAAQFAGRLEADLLRLGDLTNLARDWALSRPGLTNLNQAEWDLWAGNHRVDFDYPGFLGVGLITPVLPEVENILAAIWSQRHGFPFTVWHDPTWQPEARPKMLLEPFRAPVAVYHPWNLPPQRWLSNQTILGKDLLAMSTNTALHEIMPEPERIAEAIANGNLTSSGIIELAPEGWYGSPVRGIRIYSAAVKRPTLPPEKVTASLLSGPIAFTSVDLGRWLHSELQRSPPRLACQLWAGQTDEDRHQFGFDSSALHADAQFRPDARFRVTREVKAFYFRLWIDFASTTGFEAGAREMWQWHLCGAGLAFSALTTGIFVMQGRGRSSLRLQARQLTQANLELLKAQKERERLSRNLHDGTIQNLYAVGLHLQYARRSLHAEESSALHGVGEAQHLVQETIVELREFLLALKDEAVRGRHFRTVFGEVFERLRSTTPAELRLNVSEESDSMPSWIVVQLVQIAREALSNALRHSNASRMEIRLTKPDDQVETAAGIQWCLAIEDNGCGMPTNGGGASRPGGLGLMTMRERATELGGHLTIDSSIGKGTVIRLDFLVETDGSSPAKPKAST